MIPLLAFRNIIYRPWRSVLLFFGYGVGVAVMIVLLSVGEALLSQAKDEKLVGGGTITVLPEGLDVEVMKTGGVGGLFFSIDHSRFIYRQLLASPRLLPFVSAVAPQIEGRLIYVVKLNSEWRSVRASGEIPSANAKVHAAMQLAAGKWVDDDGDRRFIAPAPAELRHEIDHFHVPPDSTANTESWAEWHYFNVLSPDKTRWAFISFIVAGDVRTEKWGGSITITLRDQANGGRSRKFVAYVPRQDVRFSTAEANLAIGPSQVTVNADGSYLVHAIGREENGSGTVRVNLVVTPEPGAYFPGASLASGGFVSGYTVPGLRASATGDICVDAKCERFDSAQSYHDHNWGVWRGVTWDWG
ncbi:MAG: ABC transporter permease, partial [Gemmatimonadales bacterium]